MKLFFSLFFCFACIYSSSFAQKSRRGVYVTPTICNIKGNANKLWDNTTLYLQKDNLNQWEIIDSTAISNGKFEFKLPLSDDLEIYKLSCKENNKIEQVFFNDSETLILELAKDSSFHFIEGSENNKKVWQLEKDLNPFYKELKNANLFANDSQYKEKGTRAQIIKRKKEFLEENLGNNFGLYLLYQFNKDFNVDSAEKYLSYFKQDNSFVQYLQKKINNRRKCTIGADYKDLDLFDSKYNRTKLSQFFSEEKYTIVFIWEKNNEEFQKEVYELNKIYSQFKDSGICIVSILINQKREDCQEVKEISWTQLFEDIKYQAVKDVYGIEKVPFIFVVSPNGRIISVHSDTKELYWKVKSWTGN